MLRKGLAAAASLALFASACAKEPPRAATSEGESRTPRAVALESALEKYASKTATIKALVWIELSDGEEERHTEGALLLERPGSIRVDAMDALADVWAKAGSDGRRLWLYIPAKDKLYSGRASQANLRRLVNFAWEMPDIVAVVAGSPPAGENPQILQAGSPRDDHFVVRERGLHIWTDKKTGLPVKCARYEPDGSSLHYTVAFEDYRRRDGVSFPHRIEASFPARGARIVVLYRDVAFGGKADPGLFEAPRRVKGRTVELKD